GGFTAKENSGERDLVLQKDSVELAVIEAVVCTTAIDRTKLTTHFQKLFSYSTCRLFFHLTYAYIDRLDALKDYLKATATSDAPQGFEFHGLEEIPDVD